MTVTIKKNGTRLVILDVIEMLDGSPGYLVRKETATHPDPRMGQFRIRQDDVEADFK